MATKYGQEAIAAWAKRNTIFVVVGLLVIYLVLNEYVFVGSLG